MGEDERGGSGSVLRRYRLAAGLSQEELAARAGISTRSIGNIERARLQRPQQETLRLLAHALQLSPQEAAALSADARRATCGAPPSPQPMSRAEPAWPDQLPVPPTPLIGRTAELAAAAH